MQNEAILALNLLCTYENLIKEKKDTNLTDNEKQISQDIHNLNIEHCLEATFVSADVGKFIAFLLNKYRDKMEKEVFENLLALIEKLCVFAKVKDNLKKNEVEIAVASCLQRKDWEVMFERISKVSSSIDSG